MRYLCNNVKITISNPYFFILGRNTFGGIMTTVGIIAEFNPFHNGHKYLIDKAKKITNADNVIVICSGNYVQRGTPAIVDKSIRAEMAIQNGVDAFFELPVFYSTASAELFARASITFFIKLGCVDYLCFGCESDHPENVSTIASLLCKEPDEYKKYLNDFLKSGLSFPKARIRALTKYCKNNNILSEKDIDLLLSNPNNILAIEYIKALKLFDSDIKPIPIKRIGAGYSSLDIHQEFPSATGIRNELIHNAGSNFDGLIPDNCLKLLTNADSVIPDDFSSILGYKLIHENSFDNYYGVNENLSNRINNLKFDYCGIADFTAKLQSKNYTYSGISRALLHIILDIKKSDVEEFIEAGYFTFARLLGFRQNSQILSLIKEKSSINIISKFSSFYGKSHGVTRKMLDINMKADELYRMIMMNKYSHIIPTEFERKIIIIKNVL